MTLACTIAAFLILIAGLFAVIVERTNERDEARDELSHADETIRNLAAVAAEVPVPYVPAEPVLRVVREASPYDFPLADDSWFDRLYDEKGEHRG